MSGLNDNHKAAVSRKISIDYRVKLIEFSRGNETYAKFNANIAKTQKAVLGARLPALRELARELVKDATTVDLQKFLQEVDKNILEETMLAGIVIDYAKVADADKIALFRAWLPMVDSWAEIDSATPRLKWPKTPRAQTADSQSTSAAPDPQAPRAQTSSTGPDRALWWGFVDECLENPNEFTVRFGVIFMMTNLLDELPEVFERLRRVQHEAYYVKMGMAWLYSVAVLKDYEATMREMQNPKLDLWTRRKGLTKMLESYRVSPDQKAEIRALRDKLGGKSIAEE